MLVKTPIGPAYSIPREVYGTSGFIMSQLCCSL